MLLLPCRLNSFVIILCIWSFCLGQNSEIDSTKVKDPSLAWKMAFVPGLGQLYNEKYFKFIGLLSAEFYAVNRFNNLRKNGNITKRNTYGWWVMGLYFYGILDAYVDAHLSSFPKKVNKEDPDPVFNKIDSLKTEKK